MRNTAIRAEEAAPRIKASNYPEPFASRMRGRLKRPLGDLFGLNNFGVNLTTLSPGAQSALQHFHTRQDEFVFVLEGEVTLVCGSEETQLRPGMCVGFAAGGPSHHLENRGTSPVTFLEVGDRASDDHVLYPDDDLQAVLDEGTWRFSRKNGELYE